MLVRKSSMILLFASFFIITGCYQEAAPSSMDIMPETQPEISSAMPDKIEEPLIALISEEPPEMDDPRQKEINPDESVLTITPDFSHFILEKKQQNADSIGWLHIPDTTIDQVVLHKPEIENNNYYLNRSFEGLPDKNGTLCADYRAQLGSGSREELSSITAIYGHSWDDDPDGELFAQLKKFRDPEFAEKHPYIYFSTESDNMLWEIFAVFETTVCLPYIEPMLPEEEFSRMLSIVLASSIYDYNIVIGKEDKLLTLSTCVFSVEGHNALPDYNDYRFAVMARLVDPDEKIKEAAGLSVSDMVLGPDATFSLRYSYE